MEMAARPHPGDEAGTLSLRRTLLGVVIVVALIAPSPLLFAASGSAGTPHSVRMLFGDDARHEMTLVWGSALDSPQVVSYRGPDNILRTRSAVADRFPTSMVHGETCTPPQVQPRQCHETWSNYTGVEYVHVARLDGLAAGATYSYRVGSPLAGWSDLRTFRTAPASGSSVVFSAHGDVYPSPVAARVALDTAGHDPAFHLNLGDVSYSQTNRASQEEWLREWFTEQKPLVEGRAFMPAMGNHDRDQVNGSYWFHSRIWPIPGDHPPGWTFRWGDVFVASIWSDDEGVPADDARIVEQAAWLDDVLDANPDAVWRIVTMHSGLYSTTNSQPNHGHGSACGVRAALEPVLRAHDVDLVLAGHDHGYERTLPVYGGQASSEAASVYVKGTDPAYVVAGTGGPLAGTETYDYYEPPADVCNAEGTPQDVDWSVARKATAGHFLVTMDGTRLRGEFYEAGSPKAFDSFEIRG